MKRKMLAATLLLGLILLGGTQEIQVIPLGDAFVAQAASPKIVPLQEVTTSNTFTISGIWQDNDGNNISVSYSDGSLDTTVVSDSSCSQLVGHFFIKSANSDGYSNYNSAGDIIGGTMQRCTPADNPIVQNCSQPAIWYTTYNASVSNDGIFGQYVDQYWTWNTTSSGDIIPGTCKEAYTFSSEFSLTPISVTTSTTSTGKSSQASASGTQQSSGSESGTVLISGSSTTSNTSSTTTHSGISGRMGYEILAGGAVVVVAAVALSWVYLRKKP